MSDLEFKNGYTADISGSEGSYEIDIRTDKGWLIRDFHVNTNPEEAARRWIKAYGEACDGDNNVEGDYADAVVRYMELEDAIRAVLKHISSHQVYDKDSRSVLERALAGGS